MTLTKEHAEAEVGLRFKQALRGVASTVMVITATDGQRHHGMTATAVMSVSMEPPALVICINRATLLHDILTSARQFCVNVLDESQEMVSAAFSGAMPGVERFTSGQWSYRDDGLAYLSDAQANIFCRRTAAMPYGTHTLFIGEAAEVRLSARKTPLLYHDAAYRISSPRPDRH